MKFNNAYVISYISPKWDDKTREKRLSSHKVQLDWLNSLGFDVLVFAQYTPLWPDLATYLPYDGKRYLPGDARNQCLRHFYSSDQDFCLLLDDDAVLYDDRIYSGSIKEKLEKCDHILDKKISMLCPVFPEYDPYTKYIKDYSSVFSDNLVLRNKPTMSGEFIILKNLKKHYNDEIYFKEDWAEVDGSVKFGEDAIFSLDVTKKGYGSYKAWNWMRKNLGVATSSHVNKETNKERFRSLNRELASMYNLRIHNLDGKRQMVYWSEFGINHGNQKEWVIPFVDKASGLDEFAGI